MSIMTAHTYRLEQRRRPSRSGGFTLIELMVTLGIFIMIITFSMEGIVQGLRGWLPRQAVAKMLQDSRDIVSMLTDSVERAGSGEVFDRNYRASTFGAAIIPRRVTGNEFAQTGKTSAIGDGLTSDSDEVTLVGTFPITAIVANDNGSNQLTVSYVPVTRHSSTDENVSYRHFAYQFFNRLYGPRERSYYYPSITEDDIGQLLVVKSFGVGPNNVARYRMVRITGVTANPIESQAVDITYAIEQALPFNRWIQEIAASNSSIQYYDVTDGSFAEYAGAAVPACDGAADIPSIITGGGKAQSGLQTTGVRSQKCSTAALAYMHTFFIDRPSNNAPPRLARYDYTGDSFPGQTDYTVIADGVEDMQIEYFFESDESYTIPGPGVQGKTSFDVDITVNKLTAEPETARINSIRFMFISAQEAGKINADQAYPQLSNRIDMIPEYDGIDRVIRNMTTVTFALKSARSSQLYGTL